MGSVERTLKMTLATVVAILIAYQLHLDYAISAGIIALLSVLDTRKSSLVVARNRLLSFFLAFGIAMICFSLSGYTTLALALYLVVTIPLLYRF